MKIYLYQKARAEIDDIMDRYPEHLECGGQLYGYTVNPNEICIVKAFPPGKGFKPKPNTFADDINDVWEKMKAFYDRVRLGWHVAHWHTHPLPGPVRRSQQDITNARHWRDWYQEVYSENKRPHGYGTIIVHRWRGERHFGAWIYNRDGDHPAEVVDWDGSLRDEGNVEEYLQQRVGWLHEST